MESTQRILVTGGAGKVAALLRPRMQRPGRVLRLLDPRQPTDLAPGEEVVAGSVTDRETLRRALDGVDAVVHLGGRSGESDARDVIEANIFGTQLVLDEAHKAGISRVILASSNHAAGFYNRDDADGQLAAELSGRPDTLYGWSKVAGEVCGRLYADRFGMDVICLRIGLWFATPPGLRGLAMWLSPDDGARLVEACLSAEKPGFRIVWGISHNTRRWWSLAEGEAIGYFPADDAEIYADKLIAEHGEPDFRHDPILHRVGGQWCDVPLGQPFQ